MKKQLAKRFTQFAAGMSLCAAVLAATPLPGAPLPGTGGNAPQTSIETPGNGKDPGNDLGISPHDDRDFEEVRGK